MVFWVEILIAVGFAYVAIKSGLYQTWTLVFNLVIAIYLGIHISPSIESFVPASSQYCRPLAILGSGVGIFLILQSIANTFMIGQVEVTFHRSINVMGSGLLGFLMGLLLWSFASLIFCTTPFCESGFVKDIGLERKDFEEAATSRCIVWSCGFVDKFVATGGSRAETKQEIKELLSGQKKGKQGKASKIKKPPGPTDMNDVNRPSEPNLPVKPSEPNRPLRRDINSVIESDKESRP